MRVLILSFSEVARDPRVLRQLRALRAHAELSVAGFGSLADSDITFYSIGKNSRGLGWKMLAFSTLLLGLFRLHYWRQLEYPKIAIRKLADVRFDVILANDVNTLPLAFSLAANGCPILMDAHEYSPGEFSSLAWKISIGRLYHWICKRWLARVALMSSVCVQIGDLYGAKYGKNADFVVYNVPQSLSALGPIPLEPRRADGLIRLVHHGSAEPERQLERMVEMLDYLDNRFVLDLVLVGYNSKYAQRLVEQTSFPERLRILPPFPSHEIVASLLLYDVGVFLLPPVNPNYRYALPNKLFEFIQAGLAVAIGPTPPMARVVRGERVGIVATDFSPVSLANDLNAMSIDNLSAFKANSRACRSRYSSDVAEREILARVTSLADG